MSTTTFPTTNRERLVSRRKTVAAAPPVIFALLTDPAEHVRLDGIGALRGVVDAPAQLELGSVFRMQMKGYRTTNTVVEYEPDALIGWRHRGRHVWRWELRPVDGGTEVTESFDYAAKRAPGVVRALGFPKRAATALEQTLSALEARFAAAPDSQTTATQPAATLTERI